MEWRRGFIFTLLVTLISIDAHFSYRVYGVG